MPPPSESLPACATATMAGDVCEVIVAGTWQITERRPAWASVLGAGKPKRVVLRGGTLERWDSALLLFLLEVQQWSREAGAGCDIDALPE